MEERKELNFKYENSNKKEILKYITINGEKLDKLTIEGDVDLNFFLLFGIIEMFCPSMKTLEMKINESNSFKIELNLTELQNLKLQWKEWEKRIPDEIKKGIKDILEKSPKLRNLHLIDFNEEDLEEIEFPSSLKGLRVRYWNKRNLSKKIQKECKDIERLTLYFDSICGIGVDYETLKEIGRNCVNIQHLDLTFTINGYMNVSFLSEFPSLKKLYLWNRPTVEIDLFQLFSLHPDLETLHLDGRFEIKKLKNADLSKLKNFGFKLIANKYLENVEKFKSLEMMTLFDEPDNWLYRTDDFWDSFFEILPHLECIEMIELVSMEYEDNLYERIKSITQNREKVIRIRIPNENREIIPKDSNNKFIIEEWSYDDYVKIYMNLF